MTRAQVAAIVTAALVTGASCGVGSSWIANLGAGLAVGVPAGVAVWALSVVVPDVLRGRRIGGRA